MKSSQRVTLLLLLNLLQKGGSLKIKLCIETEMVLIYQSLTKKPTIQQLFHPPLKQILRIYSRNLKAKPFSGFELVLPQNQI